MQHAPLTLYTFAMSHYSEKIRWTLDACHFDYKEVVMTPVAHLTPAWRMGGKGATTLPILRAEKAGGGKVLVQDSTAILRWLSRNLGPLPVLPVEPVLYDEVMSIEDRFDAIGQDVARLLYFTGFDQKEKIIEMWTRHASKGETRFIRLFYPLIKWGFKRRLKITAAQAKRSEQRIQQALAWLEGRLSDGRLFLVGGQLTVADITAASLLAPLAAPKEHAVYGTPDYSRRMMPPGLAWREDRPGLAWVRRLYATQRLASSSQAAA